MGFSGLGLPGADTVQKEVGVWTVHVSLLVPASNCLRERPRATILAVRIGDSTIDCDLLSYKRSTAPGRRYPHGLGRNLLRLRVLAIDTAAR